QYSTKSLLSIYIFYEETCGFFIDEEKKVFVVFELDESQAYKYAYIIGENICLKKLDLGEVRTFSCPIVCSSSYVPS
ncbi:F-box associated domain type 1, partial [Arabidopsis suecica]